MSDMVWLGNMIVPRWVAFGVIIVPAVALLLLAWLIRWATKP